MLTTADCRLYKMSGDRNEYRRIRRTLTSTTATTELEKEWINDELLLKLSEKLTDSNEIYLLHDPSDIRKPYANELENLGKVRSLQGKVINGFSTHNIVGIIPNKKEVHLLFHESYSNRDEKIS